jgi:predicted dehydrogenase
MRANRGHRAWELGAQSLFPLLARQPNARLVLGVDWNPLNLQYASDLLKLPAITADPEEAFSNPEVDAVFIATSCDTDASLAARALRAGKTVFLEKPPALDHGQLMLLLEGLRSGPRTYLAVGFNRPHWPWSSFLRTQIAQAGGPASITAIVRELPIPRTHSYYWPRMGTRIVSNGCDWIDLAHYLLADREPAAVRVIAGHGDREQAQSNNVIVIEYADGSRATLVFTDRGDRRPLVHEYIDVKTERSHFMVDDFRSPREFRDGMTRTLWRGKAERGWEPNVIRALEGWRPVDRRLVPIVSS